MDYHRTATFEETKAYFRNLWRPMASESVLKNLKRILNILQSPAEEVCIVNMQEKYLSFYYMIVLDEEFLQTTFLTDECKVATHEILKSLEANRNSFTWGVSFSRQIAGIPVIFKKVYTQPCQVYPGEPCEIRCTFNETWIKTTLKFIKSTRLILKYPEMPRREAMYIYKGILKLNDEELGLDSLWLPVWEALNIFKYRYEFIVSIHPTSCDYLKFVHFEKVILKRKSCAIEDKNPISQLNINYPELLIAGETNDIKNKVTSNYRIADDVLLPAVNHQKLIKSLLKKIVTKSSTIIYTLKVDGYNMVPKPLNEKLDEVNQSFYNDIPQLIKNEAVELVTRNPNDEIVDISLSTAVQDEGNMKNIQQMNLNAIANAIDAEVSQKTILLIDNPSNYQDKTISNKNAVIPHQKSIENRDRGTIASENIVEQGNAIEDVNATDAAVVTSPAENDINCSNRESQLIESNAVIDEIGISDQTDSLNENPCFRQISKLQKQNHKINLKEEEFDIVIIDEENESDYNYTTNDGIPINKMQTINANNDNSKHLGKKNDKKKKIIPPLSLKAQRKGEAIEKSHYYNRICRKRKLLNTVPTEFILRSFKAILDFINDDSRATMEMVNLNIHEFNVLRKLYGFAPHVVPIEKIFHESCWDLAKDLFKKQALNIKRVIPHKGVSNTSGDPTRRRYVKYIKSKSAKKVQNIKTPVSILEKMDLIPVKTELSLEKRRESSGHRRSQRQSVSPPRHKLIPTGQRPPAVNPTENLTMTMKSKMLELLAVPLESDKALRMMRLMGWKGGALGVREGGLIEPIKPQLDVAKGVGLGYEKFKSTNLCTNKLQTKGMDEKYVTEQKAQNITVGKKIADKVSEKNESDISVDSKNNKDNIVAKVKLFDNPNLKGATNIDNTKKSLINVSNNVVETQNNSNQIVSKSNGDPDAWTMKSSIENNTPVNTCDDTSGKSKLQADSAEKIEGSSCLTNESISEKIKDNAILSTNTKDNVKDKNLDLKNMQTVKPISEEVLRNFQMMDDGQELEIYKLYVHNRSGTNIALCFSNRVQFLVHLLALLQSNKMFTVVSYVRQLTPECIGFIDSIICSLKKRVRPTLIPLPSESRILDACVREMEVHAQMTLSYRYRKRKLFLEKSDDSSNFNAIPASYLLYMVEYKLKVTHSVNDLYCHMPQGTEDIPRSKIATNRIILEFVKSNDRERVYDYGKSSKEIRWYIISLISLLNRQITYHHLELGCLEHSIFRETLNSMKNICLIFRFDTQEGCFTILQLVKVDLTKRCHNCHLPNKLVDNLDQTVNPHIDGIGIDDIDICQNNFGNSRDAAISKSDKNVTVDKINNEKICDHMYTVYATDCTDKIKTSEEYLIGVHGLNSKVNEDTNTKNESENETDSSADLNFTKCVEKDTLIQNDASNNEENSTKHIINTDKKENMADEEICSNFHNWPERIKKSESNNNNLTNDNIQWNRAENCKSNFRNILKRKIINLDTKTAKKATKVNIFLENNVNSDNTVVETSKNLNIELNTEERCTNFVKDITEMKTNAEVVTSDISIKDKENTEDKTLDINDPIAGEKPIINDSDMLNFKTSDVINWPKKILVVHYKYPDHMIDAISVKSLQSLLYDAIIAEQYLPRLKCNGLKKGGIIYTCYDYTSYVWLFKHLQWYTLLDCEETADNSNLIEMRINTFIKVDADIMFKNIERLYGDIKTCSWKVLRIKYFTNYCVISVEVDDSSMDAIKKEDYSLFVGIDKADISVVYNKVK